jgi:hypothetical protein
MSYCDADQMAACMEADGIMRSINLHLFISSKNREHL